MRSSQVQSPSTPYQPSWASRWFFSLPSRFEQLFPWAGKWQLFWIVVLLILMSVPLIITPLKVWQQGVVGLIFILIGWLIVRSEQRHSDVQSDRHFHVFLAWLSIITTLRYLFYRTSYTLNLDNWVDGFFSLLLLGAELYAIGTLLLSYFQTLRLKERTPIALSQIPQEQWFTVDVYIPTYNEDINLVRKTALAALAIDYPEDKKRVYILDDGRKFPERRRQLQKMCQELGCVLLTRDNNDHAKAGNINTAMRQTHGELILILDCDHIPVRQFLQQTVGFFIDSKVALVQTPHWFYNPDPFERNLLTEGHIPVHNELFYKVIQKGNDFWNAAFFCGSAAVIRKQHVLDVGGIAVETVTEDCHTSLRLHAKGYQSIYYDKIMVAGLAPETFSSYVGQQVRWARGMAQILRLENPLFNPRLKLTLPQRLCYFSASSHFFFGFPRLMYALAPILYLLCGINLVRGLGVETLVYALPHIVLGMNANYITNKTVRFSFWNEIFEYAMAFQNGIVTMMAVFNPKLGQFNVTDKGTKVDRRSFDWGSVRVPLIAMVFLVISLLSVPFWLVQYPQVQEAVVINALWAVFNLILLGVALLVALEQPQLRRSHRLKRQLAAVIHGTGQATWTGKTLDVSETGARITLDGWVNLSDIIELELLGDSGSRVYLSAKITRINPGLDDKVVITVNFVDVSQTQYDDLVLVIYSDVEEWYAQTRQDIDKPLASLGFLTTGLFRAFNDRHPADTTLTRKHIQTPAQLYWEGNFYPAMATEMSSRSVRLELPPRSLLNPSALAAEHPPVGLTLDHPQNDDNPTRLIAQVESVEMPGRLPVGAAHGSGSPSSANLDRGSVVAVELTFPKQFDVQQYPKIWQLLKTLG
jgi:cellulose synthase (UDP-forming)